jgi:hypothetical protein
MRSITALEGEELEKAIDTANKWAVLYWYVFAPAPLAIGAYLLWGFAGVVFAAGLYALAPGIAQDIVRIVHPIGWIMMGTMRLKKD